MIRVLSVLVLLAVPALQTKPDAGLPLIPVFVTSTAHLEAAANGFVATMDVDAVTCLQQGLDGLKHQRHSDPIACSTADKKYPPIMGIVPDRAAAAITVEYRHTTTQMASTGEIKVIGWETGTKNTYTATATLIVGDYHQDLTSTDRSMPLAILGLAIQVQDFVRKNHAKLVK